MFTLCTAYEYILKCNQELNEIIEFYTIHAAIVSPFLKCPEKDCFVATEKSLRIKILHKFFFSYVQNFLWVFTVWKLLAVGLLFSLKNIYLSHAVLN